MDGRMISNQGYGICPACRVGEMRRNVDPQDFRRIIYACADCGHKVAPK